jgi:outer membrane autotransporter protein
MVWVRRSLQKVRAGLMAGVCLGAVAAHATDATWSPDAANNNWNDGANWVSNPPHVVPDGTATFGASSKTSIGFSSNFTTIDNINFSTTAPLYTFTVAAGQGFVIDGTGTMNSMGWGGGIDNSSSFHPKFVVAGALAGISVNNFATVGNANFAISGGGSLQFSNDAGAAAFITNSNGGSTSFFNNSGSSSPLHPGQAVFGSVIVNDSGGTTSFFDSTNAFDASITNNDNGSTKFFNSSDAGNADITNNSNGVTVFGSPFGGDIATAHSAIILNNSGGKTDFNASSTAGNAIITNNGGVTNFNDTSTAANATIFNVGGTTTFGVNTTAGSANITNRNGGLTLIFGNAGSATITNGINGQTGFAFSGIAGTASIVNTGGSTQFTASSTADHATITNSNSGNTSFFSSSSAGNATITNENNASTLFADTSTAGNATILNKLGGVVVFRDSSTAGNATITNDGGATTFIGNSCPGSATITAINGGFINYAQSGACPIPGPKPKIIVGQGSKIDISGLMISGITFGSIEGLGTIFLGSKALTVGTNNLSTVFGGVLADGGDSGGTGGSLIKVGDGALILSGNNTYSGGTALNTGTLAVGSSTALGTGALTFASGTTLQAAANGLSLANAMTLNGTDTVDTQSNALMLSGTLSGSGGLTKIGGGTLILSGANTYTGATNVNAGILNVNGSLVSTVFVNAGGTLMGNGPIGGLVVGAGGTVAPGNSIGTFTVNGNVIFQPGSIYQVEANTAGQSDKIVASGTATLTGGTVQVLAENQAYARQTRYTILTASGGVGGAFANVTSNLAFLTPTLSYDPNDVFLTLNRNDTTFASVAQTPNQRAVAGALDRSPLFSPLVQAVVNLTGASALRAFDALSGEIHGSVQTTIVDDSRYVRQAVLGRLRQAPYANGAGAMAALSTGGPMLAYADSFAAADAVLGYADAKKPAFPIKAPPLAAPAQTPDLTFWAQGVGAWAKINSDGNAADVGRNLAGFFTGFDRRFGEWRLGAAAGYTNSSVSVSARASSANIDTAYLAAYAGTGFGAWNFRSGATFAWNTIGTSRSVVFPGFAEQASARYGAGEGQVFGELGYGMTFGGIAAEPFAGLAWVHLDTRGFTETGGVSALTGTGNMDDVGYSTLGLRAATYYLLQNGMALIPRASVAWQHAFSATTPTAALAFQSTGAGFGIWGVPIARDAALIEAGGDLQLTAQAKVGVSYAGQLANSAHNHSVKGNFTWRF